MKAVSGMSMVTVRQAHISNARVKYFAHVPGTQRYEIRGDPVTHQTLLRK